MYYIIIRESCHVNELVYGFAETWQEVIDFLLERWDWMKHLDIVIKRW